MLTVLYTLLVISGVFLIVMILLQAGKGAGAGLSIGGGMSQTMFGGSGGLDILWRRRIIRESGLDAHGELLDLCTGTGDVLFEFGARIPGCRGVGLDFSAGMLELAAKKNTYPQFEFVRGSALALPFEA